MADGNDERPGTTEEDIEDLIRHNIADVTPEQLARISSAITKLHLLYPKVIKACLALLENFYHINYEYNLEHDPLLQYGYLQAILWIKLIHEKLVARQIVHYDIQDMFISLWELELVILNRAPLIAQQFGALMVKLSAYFSELGAHLSKFAGLQPSDYLRVADVAVEKSKEVLTRLGGIEPAIKCIPPIKNFEVERLLGAGAFGAVYKALYKPANAIYTVKLVASTCFSAIEHFAADRIVASVIDHPNIVAYFAVFGVEEGAVTVMEYLKAVDLQKVVDRTKNFKVEQCRLIFAQLVAAVMHMHYCGLIHRDIKGSNALILYGAKVKLIDFDTNKVCMSHFPTRTIQIYFKRTAVEINDMEKAGTLPYMSPEVISSKAYGRALDWWSMGVTLFKILTGRCPYRGGDEPTLKAQVCGDDIIFPKFKSARPEHLDSAVDIIRGLLVKRTRDRLGSGNYADILQHPFLATMDWDWLCHADVIGKFKSFNEVMVEAATGKKAPAETPDADIHKYSPEASANTKKRKLMKLEECKDKTSHNPLFTYLSAGFRDIMRTKVVPKISSTAPMIKCIYDHAPNTMLEFNNTKSQDHPYAERLDIVVGRSKQGEVLGVRLDTVYNEAGSLFYVISNMTDSSPALGSSLLEGDLVLAINGTSVTGQSKTTVENLLSCADMEVTFSVSTSGTFRLFNSRWDYRQIVSCYKEENVEIQARKPNSEITLKSSSYYDQEHECFIKFYLILIVPQDVVGIFSGDILTAINGTPPRELSAEELHSRLNDALASNTVSIIAASSLRTERLAGYCDRLLKSYDSSNRYILEDDMADIPAKIDADDI